MNPLKPGTHVTAPLSTVSLKQPRLGYFGSIARRTQLGKLVT